MPLLKAENQLEIIPGTTSLFEESGVREKVMGLVRQWFENHLASAPDA